MSTKNKILLFCFLSIALIGVDRLTKYWAKEYLKDSNQISYFKNTVVLGYAENTGAFLSFGADWPERVSFWVFGVVPFLILIAFLIYCVRKAKDLSFTHLLPLCLIFSGGMGNIIDRLVYNRHVTDFMNLGIGSLRTGIFNAADVCVTTGVIILLFQGFKKEKNKENAQQGAT